MNIAIQNNNRKAADSSLPRITEELRADMRGEII